jgi:hypothetical protein
MMERLRREYRLTAEEIATQLKFGDCRKFCAEAVSVIE